MKKIFLYKDNSGDRDCCAYIDAQPSRFECDHYFGGVTLHGACYSGHKFAEYEDIRTVLTEDEYAQLVQFSKDIHDLGYGITKGDKRYNRGIELCKAIQPVYDKLLSEEAEEFFAQIWEEEKEQLMYEYNLDEDDIETIVDHYALDYRDSSIVGCIFKDYYDLGYEEAWSFGYVNKNDSIASRYFDFESFGEDLVRDDEMYCELSDGRIVSLMY